MSIEINTKSWHYRLIAWQNGKVVNRGLCAYVRKVITSMIWLLIGVVGVTGIAIAVGYILVVSPVMIWLMKFGVIQAYEDVVVPGLIGHGIWLFIVVSATISVYSRKLKIRNKDKQKQQSVFIEYIKAKKKKVCPSIEFV